MGAYHSAAVTTNRASETLPSRLGSVRKSPHLGSVYASARIESSSGGSGVHLIHDTTHKFQKESTHPHTTAFRLVHTPTPSYAVRHSQLSSPAHPNFTAQTFLLHSSTHRSASALTEPLDPGTSRFPLAPSLIFTLPAVLGPPWRGRHPRHALPLPTAHVLYYGIIPRESPLHRAQGTNHKRTICASAQSSHTPVEES